MPRVPPGQADLRRTEQRSEQDPALRPMKAPHSCRGREPKRKHRGNYETRLLRCQKPKEIKPRRGQGWQHDESPPSPSPEARQANSCQDHESQELPAENPVIQLEVISQE